MPTIETKDGYQVSLSGKQEEWTITDPDGNSTRIWGDPHVEESDGDKWGFKESSSFIFGNNKVTVETTQFSKNPNETLTKTITIYNGQERFSITGIDQNKLELVDWKLDAKAHDESQVDGTAYHLEPTKSEAVNWVKHD
jgi:hypothetical protein